MPTPLPMIDVIGSIFAISSPFLLFLVQQSWLRAKYGPGKATVRTAHCSKKVA